LPQRLERRAPGKKRQSIAAITMIANQSRKLFEPEERNQV
jgi:hypothetical protein